MVEPTRPSWYALRTPSEPAPGWRWHQPIALKPSTWRVRRRFLRGFPVARFRLLENFDRIAHVAEVEVKVEPADRDEVSVSAGAFDWRREMYGPAAVIHGPGDDQLVDEAIAGVRHGLILVGPREAGLRVTVLRISDFPVDTSPGDVERAARQALYLSLGVQPEPAPRGKALPTSSTPGALGFGLEDGSMVARRNLLADRTPSLNE